MRKISKMLLLIVTLAAIIASETALSAYAAEPDAGTTIKWATDDGQEGPPSAVDPDEEVGPPMAPATPYFIDLDYGYEVTRKITVMAEAGAFEGIAKAGGMFKPDATFTRRQYARIVKNIWGIKLNMTDPDKKVTATWASKRMKELHKKLGIDCSRTYRTGSDKLTRAEVALEVYDLFEQTCMFVPYRTFYSPAPPVIDYQY